MEKKIKSEEIYRGKVVSLYKDEVKLDDGSKAFREVVLHHGGACIALRNKRGNYYMVKQYRYAQGMEMLEFCAGKLNRDEDPKEAVLREASEELGVSVKNLKDHGYMVPTCGYSTERIYLFSGDEDERVGQHLDEDERLEVFEYSLKEIKAMIKDHRINDAKTICLASFLSDAEKTND